MSRTSTERVGARRERDWRLRENRESAKMVAKRVSATDHAALLRYAEHNGVKVAEMLEPFVAELIRQAHEFCETQSAGTPKAS